MVTTLSLTDSFHPFPSGLLGDADAEVAVGVGVLLDAVRWVRRPDGEHGRARRRISRKMRSLDVRG